MGVIRLSALHTSHLYPLGYIPGTHFCWWSRRPLGHSAAGRNRSMKNTSDPIKNRTYNLPACRAVTPSRIKPTTFQLVGQCLNQLHYHMPPQQVNANMKDGVQIHVVFATVKLLFTINYHTSIIIVCYLIIFSTILITQHQFITV